MTMHPLPRRARWAATLLLALLTLAPDAAAQVWGEIRGRVTEAATGEPIPGANVIIEGTSFGTNTARDGRYSFAIPEGRYLVRFTFVGYETLRDSVAVARGLPTTVDVRLAEDALSLGEAQVTATAETQPGISVITPQTIRNLPTPLSDALRTVKTELGVTSNNELSNAYSVRGGSYDENQFFIDGFEIYRPLRTRQGEQEGLGLVNGDLAESLTLYAGGFPVRYGGKLASVLDVDYVRPVGQPTATAYGSMLDGGLAAQTGLGGAGGLAVAARAARPAGLFGTQELEGDYDPDFRDVQGVAYYDLGRGAQLRAVGLYARHRFRFEPSSRETTFGIFPNLVRTVALEYDGSEEDGYDVGFGGLMLANTLGPVRAEHRASAFTTTEFEGFEIRSRSSFFRRIQAPDRPQGDLDRIATGNSVLQTDVADNEISQTVLTAQGRYLARLGRQGLEAGWQVRSLRFDDRISEYTDISGRDSLDVPVDVRAREIADAGTLDAVQAAVWLDDAVDLLGDRLTVTPGVRVDYFDYNDEWTVSPRLGATYRAGLNTTVSGSAGVYYQAPTYRELRGDPEPGETILDALDGDIRSQRAVQGVVGVQHLFTQRRLLLRAEAYGKLLSDLISYDAENTRVVYSGENDSEGYAYGLDLQLRGELVPGLESWINYGFLKTEERFNPLDPFVPTGDALVDSLGRAAVATRYARLGGGNYVARPTDRRHNVSVFVQDYVPGDDTFSVHIRALYGTGLPYTPPAVSDTINGVAIFEEGRRHALRFPSYTRFDLGASKELNVGVGPGGRPLVLRATAEVLNVFDQTNTVAFSFVERNSDGRRFFESVPTRLTPRTFNVRLRLDF